MGYLISTGNPHPKMLSLSDDLYSSTNLSIGFLWFQISSPQLGAAGFNKKAGQGFRFLLRWDIFRTPNTYSLKIK